MSVLAALGWQAKLGIGLSVVLAILGAVLWHGGQVAAVFKDGELAERNRWQAARAELLELRRQRAEWSASKGTKQLAALPAQVQKEITRVEIHWRDRPVRECMDDDSVRATEAARAALRRAAAASGGHDPL
jgi:hypothetical protein